MSNMRYEDSMKGVADQIIKEQQRVSKIINNPEEFHWHDEYATLNFFRFICKNIGNLRNGEIEKMATRLKNIDQKAVENHVNGAVWAFDYDKMFCVLMENEICQKVCEKTIAASASRQGRRLYAPGRRSRSCRCCRGIPAGFRPPGIRCCGSR